MKCCELHEITAIQKKRETASEILWGIESLRSSAWHLAKISPLSWRCIVSAYSLNSRGRSSLAKLRKIVSLELCDFTRCLVENVKNLFLILVVEIFLR